jgi:flagellar biosynthetic protein FliP
VTTGLLLTLLGGLAAVLGVLTLLVAAVRRLGGLQPQRSRGQLRVTDRAGLGQRQGVAVVEVEGVRILVGFGEGGVRYLTELDEGRRPPLEAEDERAFETSRPATFPSLLATAGDGTGGRWNRVSRLLRDRLAWPLACVLLAAAPGNLAAVPAGPAAAMPSAAPAMPGTAQAVPPAPVVPQAAPGVPPGTAQEGEGRGALLRSRLPDLRMSLGQEDGEGLQVSGPVGIVLFMGFLTLLPTLLLLMTSFTRILVVLHLLKQALGTQTAPPGHLVAAMALLLTGFVMAPTLSEANRVGVDPWVRGEIDEVAMLQEASVPFRSFMLSTMRQQDLEAFMEMGRVGPVETVEDVPLVVVMTAFVTSELRAAFQMGFALFLPFVVIDLVVASVLMSMGMFMLPPIMVSLPFKLLLFVMVDGWTLVMEGIVRSFPY